MANFNLNKVILAGRLTEDPELKTTPSGVSVTTFSIAVNRKAAKEGEAQADFFYVTAWRQTAEFITKFFRKASSICVSGSLQNRIWVDQRGVKRYATEVVADEVYFVDSKAEAPQGRNVPPTSEPPAGYYGKTADPYTAAATGAGLEELEGDGELTW